MHIITDFSIELNKKRVFNALGYGQKEEVLFQLEEAYQRASQELSNLVCPQALYKFVPLTGHFAKLKGLEKCGQVVLGVATLGPEITQRITELFSQGDYLVSLTLDTMADELLFSITKQLQEKILREAETKGLGLTCRFEPGNGDIPLTLQEDICRGLKAQENLALNLTEGLMLNPVKSITFFYGAGYGLPSFKDSSPCEQCSRKDCSFRNDEEITLTIVKGPEVSKLKTKPGLNLWELLRATQPIPAPCGGQGRCGKCRIKIKNGQLPVTQKDQEVFSSKELEEGYRLACTASAEHDLIIELPEEKLEFAIEDEYYNQPFLTQSSVSARLISFTKEEVKQRGSLVALLQAKLGGKYSFKLKALEKLALVLNKGNQARGDNRLWGREELSLIFKGDTVLDIAIPGEEGIYGVAIDIGTTTLALALVDLVQGKVVQTQTALNSQSKFGADVISRIKHSSEGQLETLRQAICADLLQAMEELLKSTGLEASRIYQAAVAGNTTMLHLFLGLPCESLAVYPFTTVTTELQSFTFQELFNSNFLACEVEILPGVSAYVGADIVAGLLNCGFPETSKVEMLIDIGTNGEMALGNGEKIICLSTAAGPAFEGVNISQGMGSVKGAISQVKIKDNKTHIKTIGNASPVGICGSGVIDIAAQALENRMVDETGRIGEALRGQLTIAQHREGYPINFTQKDVREVQLAKGAIRAGIEILMKRFQVNYQEIATVYLAGGFGTKLNLASAVAIGLIPEELAAKVKTVGNSSLGGAIHYLLNKEARGKLARLLAKTSYLDLSADPEFNDLFVENMLFPKRSL